MNDMNNEKNKSSVILNPERREWVSRSHVTSVEIVVNDGAKTKRYSVKRALYASSPNGSRLKMTEKILSFLRLRGASDIVGIRNVITRRTLVRRGYLSEQGTHANKESLFANVTWLMRLPRRIQRMLLVMTIPALALIFTFTTTTESLADESATTSEDTTQTQENPKLLPDSGSCGKGCLYEITTDSITGARNLRVYNTPNYTGVANIAGRAFSYEVYGEQANFNKIIIKGDFDNVGYDAFRHSYYSNNGFNELIFEGKIKNIGERSFYGNTLISDITLPEGLEKIGKSAFSHNFNVSSLVIPDTVTDIDSNAFSFINLGGDDYSRIDSVTLPESLVRTGDYIFNNSNIGEIVIPDTLNTDTWSEKTFFNDNNTPSSFTVACKGFMKECQKAMSRFIAKTEDGIGSCEGKYCLNPNRISFASASEASCKGERYWYHDGVCQLNPLTTYAKKRWTPAEANEWLHDGNDNFVIITFKK